MSSEREVDMISQKRRKKRQSHGLRTIELQRGKQGYGFTISGQQPCVLGNIIPGSPADDQGMCVCVCVFSSRLQLYVQGPLQWLNGHPR